MVDTSWNIETDTSGTITIPGATGDTFPSFSVGDDITIAFLVDEMAEGEIDILREFVRYANDSTSNTGLDIRGRPWYHESIHPQSSYSSQLVHLVPGDVLSDIDDWWCVITSGTFSTNSIGVNRQVELELFVVARGAEYSDRALVENEFEAGL
ncbi:hypothetical protein [Natrialba asiatica]|uniref:Uncharacterized protein n=1 Tax=Natrialba asiatica (strain ATCC 700177 / DSM 12278 / JCM 9576 / FERM P-10747 / NBRC 102637 / 172P1) TaxID=29540 RepID=M0APV9_NATA1|nr:hypothetical protein [Natrialba asiatica]ELZ00761.1 hypothetical protein C481_11020 [Natrialba asiatica DSM 12278]